jgi:hypothetical protein
MVLRECKREAVDDKMLRARGDQRIAVALLTGTHISLG